MVKCIDSTSEDYIKGHALEASMFRSINSVETGIETLLLTHHDLIDPLFCTYMKRYRAYFTERIIRQLRGIISSISFTSRNFNIPGIFVQITIPIPIVN